MYCVRRMITCIFSGLKGSWAHALEISEYRRVQRGRQECQAHARHFFMYEGVPGALIA